MNFKHSRYLPLMVLIVTLAMIGILIALKPIAVVVPHHDLVRNQRRSFLKVVSLLRPWVRKIVLIGPDHFSRNRFLVTFANKDWTLSNGTLPFEVADFDQLTNIATLSNQTVSSDHAIVNLLPKIKQFWPKASIIPILIGDMINPKNLDGMIATLGRLCNYDCLLIASVDFSHYLPWPIASIHDAHSLKFLSEPDSFLETPPEVDSPQSLFVAKHFSSLNNAPYFFPFDHTNSALIEGTIDSESTSHLFGFYTRLPMSIARPATFTYAAIGNIAFDFDTRVTYGTDDVDFDLKTQHCWGTFCIQPTTNPSSYFDRMGSHLFLHVGRDLLLTGEVDDRSLTMVLSPIRYAHNTISFIKNSEREIILKQLFTSLDPEYSSHVDIKNGIFRISL